MKRASHLILISILALIVLASCAKKEERMQEIISSESSVQESTVSDVAKEEPAAPSISEEAKAASPTTPSKTDKLTGLVFSNRKDTYEAYDEKSNSQREKMGPAAYPNGAEYERFEEIIGDFMGSRRQAGYDYLISYSFLENGYIEIFFADEYMYGTYSLDGNNIYIDNGQSLLGVLSDDGLTIENNLIEGKLYLELPIIGTFTNSNDMMMDYLALFNEEMRKNNITDYDDEVFTDWFMLTYGNVDEYTEQNAVTATFLENGFAYILKADTSKFSQYSFDENDPSVILIDGVPMFAMYEGGYDIKPFFQYSIMERIEMPEETKKYL